MVTRSNSGNGRGRPRNSRQKAKAIRANPFVSLVAEMRPDIERRLADRLAEQVEKAAMRGPELHSMVQAIRDLAMRGGKRFRAGLVIAGYRAATQSESFEPALDGAVALELLQTYLLIHDDWMDGDRVRRGGPAVHVQLGRAFRSQALGNASAVLAGDFAAAMAADSIARAPATPRRLVRAMSCLAQMQLDVVAGQQLDLVARSADVETVYALKTSSYSVAGPIQLGAALGGASPALQAGLGRFAVPLGVAFQLRDDLLGLFGDSKATGKPVGGDLRSGKNTLIFALARQRLRGDARKAFRAAFGNPRATLGEVNRARRAIADAGLGQTIEGRICELTDDSRVQLGRLRLRPDGRSLLEGAAEVLTSRRS